MSKKVIEEIINNLQANQDKTVADVLPDIISLAASSSSGRSATNFHKNEEGETTGIKCYYHKLWMDPRMVEFGKKASSPTGLNVMCKDGANKWNKQNRDAKIAEAELLDKVISQELAVEDIPAEQERIHTMAQDIIPRDDGYGFETLEELLEAQQQPGYEDTLPNPPASQVE